MISGHQERGPKPLLLTTIVASIIGPFGDNLILKDQCSGALEIVQLKEP